MKTKIFFILFCNLMAGSLLFAQSINITLGPGGAFTLKDASTNYFTLSQSTGQVNILKTLRLENTTSATTGIIFKGVDRFIHNYGTDNMFIGINSGNFTLTGVNNTAVGKYSLFSNSTGNNNTAMGWGSLNANTTGNNNIAVGYASLNNNVFGNNNSAFGNSSLQSNMGGNNSAFGYLSLQYNTTGSSNSAFGSSALVSNTTGGTNSAFGLLSLNSNTVGVSNSAFGFASLNVNTTGSYNSAFGNLSLQGNTTGSNNTAIGYNAQVSATLSNQVRIGNEFVTSASVQVAWFIGSDRRWKSDIQNSGLGLGFITKLRPVSYFRNNDESKKTEYGFIAQEVEEVLKESGIENSGMLTITDEGMYELRSNDLLAPMVKAIQELNEKCAGLESENSQLKSEVESLKDMKVKLAELEQSQMELIKMVKSGNSKETQSVNISDNK